MVAERHYRTLLGREQNIDDVINLGALLRSQGRLQEGSLFYQSWINKFERDERLILNACNCWNDNNEANLAIHYLEKLVKEEKPEKELLLCYADSLSRVNRIEECNALLNQCLRENGSSKKTWIRLGLNQAKNNKLHEALEAFKKANEIDPEDLDVLANRITLLKDLGNFNEAEKLINELSSEKRLHIDIAQATAGMLMAQNKLVEATHLYRYICEKSPKNANYWLNWAAALRGLRWTVAPYRILKRALCYEPSSKDVQEAILQIIGEMSRSDLSKRCIDLWPQENKSIKEVYLFNRQFLGVGTGDHDSQLLAAQARTWEKNCLTKLNGNLWQDIIAKPLKERKLRVGYLSADFANHPVGRFMLPILNNHDKAVVEVWAINCGSHDDWITEHIRKSIDHWVDLRFRTITEGARIVADLGLDILVELGGFSADSRLGLLCHRPAPVQLSYLGYPGPTYLECINGWIGDRVLFEQLNDIDRAAHPLIEIDGGYMVFDAGGELPKPKRTANNRFRFGSFNHARKLTQSTIELFCKVMNANPETELVLKSISFCEPAEQLRIRQRFVDAGLESERLVLLDWVEGGINHLQLYSEIDVALDPIPYGGATTTAEALWMGVPVVALAGAGMVGRLAATLLIHGNQEEWVARNEVEYINIAKALAQKGKRLSSTRCALRESLQKSPLANGRRLSQALEEKYLELRQRIKPY